MKQPCPHCDQPDASFLRLVLMSEIPRADETLLVLLTDVLHQSGLLHLSEKSTAPRVRPQQGTLRMLRRSGVDDQ